MKWKPVLGWEGFYEVSDTGMVRSCPKKMNAGWAGLREYKGKVISQFKRQGRRFVNLSDDGRRATCTVHRLVLEAFRGPRPSGKECRHLDGNTDNNNLLNLAWGTKFENECDRVIHGTRSRPPLSRKEFRAILVSRKKQQELADRYGITQSMVSRIKSGERIWH